MEQLFNEIDNAATEQKQQNEVIDLIYDVLSLSIVYKNKWHLRWRWIVW